jgi:hypothetical protein
MANNLKFTLGADVSEALKGMTAVEQRSIVLQKQIQYLQQVVGNTNSIKQFNTAMDSLNRKQSQLSQITAKAGASLRGIQPGANEATQSLTNLSRIAQDAPFGFIGISNNINPLLESFQRLKASTGSTGGALKALAGSLTGAGGLGLAVGIGTGLLTVFGDKLFNIGKASKEAEDGTQKLGEAIASDLVKLTSLVGLASNVNASYSDRTKAIKALNEQYSKYLDGLGKEQITLNNLATAYDTIVQKLLQQAVVKGAQQEIEKIVAETAGKIIKLKQQEAKATEETAAQYEKEKKSKFTSPTAQQQLDRLVKTKENENGVVRDGTIALQNQQIEQVKAIRSVNIYDSIVKRLTDDLKKQLSPLMNLTTEFSDLDETLKSVSEKEIKFDELSAINIGLRPFEKILTQLGRAINVDKIKIAVSGVAFEPKPSFFEQLQSQTSEQIAKAFPEAFQFKVAATIDKSTVDSLKKVVELNNLIGDQIKNVVGSAINSLFDALKRGENAFKAFGNAAINALLGVIEKLLATAATAAILSFIFPVTGVGGAVGFQNIFSSLLGFRANGGPVSGNSPYIVGERGPELFVPSVSGRVVPNNQLGSFNGRSSFATGGGGRSIVRGTDILLASARTQRSINRVNA